MPQYEFGSGSLWGIRTDASGVLTPRRFGGLQDISLDISFSIKELFGERAFPLAIGRGTGKITCKAKKAQIIGLLYADLFFGLTAAVGSTLLVADEILTVPAPAGPYTDTVANGADFDTDLGVCSALTGVPLVKVAADPATGEYAVSSVGVYTFAAADTGLNFLASYSYTSAATGKKVTVTNPLLGETPTFEAWFLGKHKGKSRVLKLPCCVSSKLSFATKLEDFVIPEFEFSCFANDAGVIMYHSSAE